MQLTKTPWHLCGALLTAIIVLNGSPLAAQWEPPPGEDLEPRAFREEGEEPAAREVELADLRFTNGLRAVFSFDEDSGEFGLLQEGVVDRSGPIVEGHVESLLAVFLQITPEHIAVPELLLAEPGEGSELARELAGRRIAPERVFASDLQLPAGGSAKTAKMGCFGTHFAWFDWHDNAAVGMAPKAYYASSFGGKKRYSDSYIANCTPSGSGSWLWARHRIYYKNAFGNYKKHFEGKVAPWHWQAKHKGSAVKRYRRVIYDDGWNSSPSCGSCKYTREGRFHN